MTPQTRLSDQLRDTQLSLRDIGWTFLASAILFFVNNVLLARLLVQSAGGTTLGIPSVIAVSIIAVMRRRFGVITLLYLFYGLMALPSHWFEAGYYSLGLAHRVGAALVFDCVATLGRFRWWSILAGFALFAGAILVRGGHLGDWPLVVFRSTAVSLLLFAVMARVDLKRYRNVHTKPV